MDMEYAGFWKRFIAAIIDFIILIAGSFAMIMIYLSVWVAGGTVDLAELDDPALSSVMESVLNLLGLIIHWAYFAGMESSPTQGTLGKMVLGIKVTDLEGHRISFNRGTGRYFGKIISTLLLLVGFIMIAFTQKKQGLHDIIAHCLVVKK